MKLLVLAVLSVLVAGISVLDVTKSPKILRTVVMYDTDAAAEILKTYGAETKARLLSLAQETNNVLNRVDLHLQLHSFIEEWPENNFKLNKTSSAAFYAEAKKELLAGLTTSVHLKTMGSFYIILTAAKTFEDEGLKIMTNESSGCGRTALSVINIRKKGTSGIQSDALTIHFMVQGLLANMGVGKAACNCGSGSCILDDSESLVIPSCAKAIVENFQETERCLTMPGVWKDKGSICGNSILEPLLAGSSGKVAEQCDCASFNLTCMKCCDMSECQILPNCGGTPPPNLTTPDDGGEDYTLTIAIVVCVVLVLMAGAVVIGYWYWRKHHGSLDLPVSAPAVAGSRKKSQGTQTVESGLIPAVTPASQAQPGSAAKMERKRSGGSGGVRRSKTI